MSTHAKPDAERLQAVIRASLDQDGGAGDWAHQAAHSRSQFFRLFQALIEETPGAMRRRLLLERAAWHLANTTRPVTGVAFDAGYGSLEAFTRNQDKLREQMARAFSGDALGVMEEQTRRNMEMFSEAMRMWML